MPWPHRTRPYWKWLPLVDGMFLQFKCYFLISIVMLQKSTVCLINWYKGRNLLVSPKGEGAVLSGTNYLAPEFLFWFWLWDQRNRVTLWTVPKLWVFSHWCVAWTPRKRAACSSHICPRSPGAVLQLRGSSGRHPSPGAQEGGRGRCSTWGGTLRAPVRVCAPGGLAGRWMALLGCGLMCLHCKVGKCAC